MANPVCCLGKPTHNHFVLQMTIITFMVVEWYNINYVDSPPPDGCWRYADVCLPEYDGRNQLMQKHLLNSFGELDNGFAPYGEYWRKMRKICVLELLSLKRVQAFHFVRLEEVGVMIEKICNKANLDGANFVNLGEMFVDIASSIVSRCVLERKYEEEDNKKRFEQLAKTETELLV
ncbi:hypothetical protein ACSBR1_011911 [Camellia fascicularis]